MKYTSQYLRDFVSGLFQKFDCPEKDANTIAEILVKAELRGISSHGMIRVPDYVVLWEQGRIKSSPDVRIVHETPSTAVVDGDSAFGMVAAKKSMEIAIEKAKTAGTGWISTRNSNHYGIAGYYAMMALEHDMAGIAMTNANPLVAPTFSKSRLLGTNPVAAAIPAGNHAPFVADFATTPIARGKLTIKGITGEKVPHGYVQDKDGNPSHDPDILKEKGAILPLGGSYEFGSHKGFCMGAIVDIFSAVFSGANFGPFVPPSVPYLPVLEESTGEGLGHFFGAVRIDAFQPPETFKSKMDEWIDTFKNANPVDGRESIIIPGEPEFENEQRLSAEGITILPQVISKLKETAKKYNMEFKT